MLREPSSKRSFGASLASMMDGDLAEAAEALDYLVESGEVPVKHAFECTLYAALGYDIANEPHDAQRMYRRLEHTTPPDLEHFVLSRENSRLLTDSLVRAGLRDSAGLGSKLSRLMDGLNARRECMRHVDDAYRDDYTVLLATVHLLAEAIGALASSDAGALTRASSNAARFYDELEKFSPEPWIAIVAALATQLIGKLAERAVAGLKVPDSTKSALFKRRILEVWKTQQAAVGKLLGGESLVCSSPPGTGKSFMAYLAAGSLEQGAQMAYLVPTRSLADQVFDDLRGMAGYGGAVAVSTRDRTEHDDRLSEQDVVVATYEKMGALVSSGRMDPARVRRVVADEIHIVGDEARGMAAEMTLARLMEGSPQVIGLSGLLGKQDARRLSEWLGAVAVESSWKGTEISEKILLDGTAHVRGGGEENIPLLAGPGSVARKRRIAAAARYASLAVRESEAALISVASRRDAFEVAGEIMKGVRSPPLDDYGVIPILKGKLPRYREAAGKIRGIEPSIPAFGERMIEMLESGIACHHAGLPRRYRKAVEEGVRDGKIDVVVATSTLEAGVNMPIKTVVFFEPGAWNGSEMEIMDGRKYRNIAGRAGRAGYHRTGNVVVIAATPEESEKCKKAFWESRPEPLQSAFFSMVWRGSGPAASALRSHVLSRVTKRPGGIAEIVDSLRRTWFYRQDPEAGTRDLEPALAGSVEALERYGLIRREQGGQLSPTQDGIKAGESGLTPDAAAAVMAGLRRLKGDARTPDLLLLACLSDDLQDHARRAGKAEPLACVAAAADRLSEPALPGSPDMAKAAKCASLLHCWIEPRTSSEIAGLRGIDPEIGPPVSEDMAAGASRALQSVAALAGYATGNSGVPADIRRLADACLVGSRDPAVRDLIGLDHGGRDSAIKISRMLSGRHAAEAERGEIVGLFPGNKDTAAALFDEIQDFYGSGESPRGRTAGAESQSSDAGR